MRGLKKHNKNNSLALVLYDGSMQNNRLGWNSGKVINDNKVINNSVATAAPKKIEKKAPEKYYRFIASDTF